jgi:hypothetical protein
MSRSCRRTAGPYLDLVRISGVEQAELRSNAGPYLAVDDVRSS